MQSGVITTCGLDSSAVALNTFCRHCGSTIGVIVKANTCIHVLPCVLCLSFGVYNVARH